MPNHIFTTPPFLQCHGSTLISLSDGSIAVAWFAGSREGHSDTSIWWCRQRNGEWEQPFELVKCGNVAHWNPVLHSSGDGTLSMYFKTGKFPDSWDTWFLTMDENGCVLSEAVMLDSQDLEQGKMTLGPVRGKMIVTSKGTLIAPSSIEKVLNKRLVGWMVKRDALWNSVIHRSVDNGKTWTSVIVPFLRQNDELGGIIQPSVWEGPRGCLAALFRSTNGVLYRSESNDDGVTWTTAWQTIIPNPNSAVDVAKLGNVVALIYNPIDGNWARRSPLSVAFAESESGLSFKEPVHIENGPGSYSYPAIIATSNGFAATYTWNRRTIAFVNIGIDNGCPVIEAGPKPYSF